MLPYSRNRTYGDGTPVVPADMNDLQDGEIGGKHGTLTAWFAPTLCVASTNFAQHQGYIEATGAPATIFGIPIPLTLPEGTLILGLKLRAKGTGGGPAGIGTGIAFTLERWFGDGTVDGASQAFAQGVVANAWATFTTLFTVPNQFSMVASESLVANLSADTIGQRISSLGIVYARP